ncbi:hypothetical protein [Nitratiruptor sp. SB155-2]|uniref:hypothetical protein n=1 Tax=Nitratiruptor sp. (strain SB155-2) TaxID=387092 RepID=UPI0001586F4A|nr:hypothetical protein [Nitratiruptor sp. SB155-2]BAF69573.1 hypothetical protein NIS_0459 [Nitratiruptor sp. SB155-2]BAN05334.1 hypothetical protein [Nitratiruptor phage NrS-1]
MNDKYKKYKIFFAGGMAMAALSTNVANANMYSYHATEKISAKYSNTHFQVPPVEDTKILNVPGHVVDAIFKKAKELGYDLERKYDVDYDDENIYVLFYLKNEANPIKAAIEIVNKLDIDIPRNIFINMI